jgi:hypothetical protein
VLTSPRPSQRHTRLQRSLRQEYEEFILERIEEFKQQISRQELLRIADEAVRELEVGPDDQLLLTEVLMLEHVDRLIIRRLNLPGFRRWLARHRRLRRAQRAPTHWGLDPRTKLVEHAQSFPMDGTALVVGAGAAPACFFLAAHDWAVVFIDPEIAQVEGVESRAAAEALAMRFEAFVVNPGTWFPEVEPTLAVIDPGTLGALEGTERDSLLHIVKHRTISGGVHHLLFDEHSDDVLPLLPEALRHCYSDWHVERARAGRSNSFMAVKP